MQDCQLLVLLALQVLTEQPDLPVRLVLQDLQEYLLLDQLVRREQMVRLVLPARRVLQVLLALQAQMDYLSLALLGLQVLLGLPELQDYLLLDQLALLEQLE